MVPNVAGEKIYTTWLDLLYAKNSLRRHCKSHLVPQSSLSSYITMPCDSILVFDGKSVYPGLKKVIKF